ncbi:MAG: ribonuclease T, partial [Gammaproteobacteria bacterium]
MTDAPEFIPMERRFRGYLPIVVDVETGGFNSQTDALLEIGAVAVGIDKRGFLHPVETYHYHVQPFENANMDPASLKVIGIDPYHPLRIAVPEHEALAEFFKKVRERVKQNQCTRAILVGHNASFDLGFINAAAARTSIKRNPFHPFSSMDTVTLGAMAYGQTVLSRALEAAELGWNDDEAHSAMYDAQKTAELFCAVLNKWE